MNEVLKKEEPASSRRTLLKLGAVAVPALVTLKASPAAAQVSILNCEIPFNTAELSGKWISADGNAVPSETAYSYRLPATPYTGQQIKDGVMPSGVKLTNGQPLTEAAWNAHVNYINKLTYGKPGFTCYASIKNRPG